MMRALLLGAAIAAAFVGYAVADEMGPYSDQSISCAPAIEFEPQEQMLHLRHAKTVPADCPWSQASVAAELDVALAKQVSKPALRLVFLGRLENYAWLSTLLTEQAVAASGPTGAWLADKGHARGGNDNAFVAEILARHKPAPAVGGEGVGGLLMPFVWVLARYGYRIDGVSVEKVMSKEIDGRPGKFPYDALVHLRIGKVL
jgi:hypothetical protein